MARLKNNKQSHLEGPGVTSAPVIVSWRDFYSLTEMKPVKLALTCPPGGNDQFCSLRTPAQRSSCSLWYSVLQTHWAHGGFRFINALQRHKCKVGKESQHPSSVLNHLNPEWAHFTDHTQIFICALRASCEEDCRVCLQPFFSLRFPPGVDPSAEGLLCTPTSFQDVLFTVQMETSSSVCQIEKPCWETMCNVQRTEQIQGITKKSDR